MDLQCSKEWHRYLCLIVISAGTLGCATGDIATSTLNRQVGSLQAGVRPSTGNLRRGNYFAEAKRRPHAVVKSHPVEHTPSKPKITQLANLQQGPQSEQWKQNALLTALENCEPELRITALAGLDKSLAHKSRAEPRMTQVADLEQAPLLPEEQKFNALLAALETCEPALRTATLAGLDKSLADEVRRVLNIHDAQVLKHEQFAGSTEAPHVSYRYSDSSSDIVDPPKTVVNVSHSTIGKTHTQSRPAVEKIGPSRIENPDQLVTARAIHYKKASGELQVRMPSAFNIQVGWKTLLVDGEGRHSLAEVTDVGGLSVRMAIELPHEVNIEVGQDVKVGLVATH